MPDIYHDFPIGADPQRVFDALSSPAGLDQWWTKSSVGTAKVGAEYELGPVLSEHYRISSYCWAIYLRVLRRYLEHGERVAYEQRLDV